MSHAIIPPADTTVNSCCINAPITQRLKPYTIQHTLIITHILSHNTSASEINFPLSFSTRTNRPCAAVCDAYRGQIYCDDEDSVDPVKGSFTINEHHKFSEIAHNTHIFALSNLPYVFC